MRHHVTDILRTAGRGIEFHKMTVRHLRDYRSNGGLPAAGRSEKKDGRNGIPLNHTVKERILSYCSFLAQYILQPLRPHTVCQGRIRN